MRLAVSSGAGVPIIVSLWFLWRDGALWLATSRKARIVAWLRANADCGFEVAPERPPYRGVRGQGRASLVEAEGMPVLHRLLARYEIAPDSGLSRMLRSRPAEQEVAIRIDPDWMTSWDYSARMAGALPEVR